MKGCLLIEELGLDIWVEANGLVVVIKVLSFNFALSPHGVYYTKVVHLIESTLDENKQLRLRTKVIFKHYFKKKSF